MSDAVARLNVALKGRYRVERELGEGGMATVYLADDLKHERKVALKVLKPELAAVVGAERFLAEIKTTAHLQHPHVLPLFDSGEADGFLFYLMPFIDGESLRDRLKRERQLPIDEALTIAREVADGLGYAHDQDVIHRDIKPGNILLSGGHAVIADFGIARAVSSVAGEGLTETGMSVGTPKYMSPEQASGEHPLDGRSDIYALGCVLYEMLVGEPPYSGASAQLILAKILTQPPISPRILRDTVPEVVDQAVMKALSRVPADRFSNAGEFAEALTEEQASPRSWRSATLSPRPPSRMIGAAVVGAALVWLGLTFGTVETLAYTEGEWILVTEFDNITGDSILDKSLDLAFGLTLQQSPLIKVFPDSRIQQALGRMMLDEGSRITRSVGMEIAEREGIRFVIVPSVASVGERYVLGLAVHDPQVEGPLHTELISVDSDDEILPGLDALGAHVREIMGESRRAIRQQVALLEVTTASLPALRQFSLGIEAFARFTDTEEARRLMESALAIDSGFTAAHAQLGALELNFFDREKGVQHLTRALANLDELTDYESLMVRGLYADLVENDPESAMEIYQTTADLFPNKPAPPNNLGWLFWRLGRFEESVAQYREALRIDEGFTWAYGSMNRLQLFYLGMIDSARVAAERQIRQDEEYDWGWNHLGWAYVGRDSVEAANGAFRQATELNPSEPEHWRGLAQTYRLQGQFGDAASTLEQILELDSMSLSDNLVLSTVYQLGQLYQSTGEADLATPYLLRARQMLERQVQDNLADAGGQAMLALVLTRLGDAEGGEAALQQALEVDPVSPEVLFDLARVAMAQGSSSTALAYLERLMG